MRKVRERLFLVNVLVGTLILWPIAVVCRRLFRNRPYLMR